MGGPNCPMVVIIPNALFRYMSNEFWQKSNNKIYNAFPYIAPEIVNGEPYKLSSDIYYSLG